MTFFEGPLATILIVGAAQGFVLGFVLLSIRRGNRRANRLLAAILMMFSVSIVIHATAHTPSSIPSLHHENMVLPFYMLIAPLLYWYTRHLTKPDLPFKRTQLYHGLPCLVFVLSHGFRQSPG